MHFLLYKDAIVVWSCYYHVHTVTWIEKSEYLKFLSTTNYLSTMNTFGFGVV